MITTDSQLPHRQAAISGAIAGLAGGLVFGASMAVFGTLSTVASIVHADSVVVGFFVHMLFALVIGAGFGVLVVRQQVRSRETIFWGLIYGTFWWFLGPQTLLPLFRGKPVAWDLGSARALLPSLIGHLFYGATVAAVFVLLCRVARVPPTARSLGSFLRGPFLRGGVAGAIVAFVLRLIPGFMTDSIWSWLLIAVVTGVLYPALFSAQREITGPALCRGTIYGFLCWIAVALSFRPLFHDGKLGWSEQAITSAGGQLPGYLLLGAGIAVLFTWLGALARGLFVDDVRLFEVEAHGVRGIRATGYGALAGLAGGLVFTVVMVLVDALPRVASMVGSATPAVGLIVHLVIAQIIGVSYAILFRRRSFDLLSGMGWGVSYGFFWWILGDLTLLPVLSGGVIHWDSHVLATAFPSLVGHLGYGAALGAVYYRLEARTNPWWMTRSDIETARAAIRRDQALGAAPALWVLTVVIALTLPILG